MAITALRTIGSRIWRTDIEDEKVWNSWTWESRFRLMEGRLSLGGVRPVTEGQPELIHGLRDFSLDFELPPQFDVSLHVLRRGSKDLVVLENGMAVVSELGVGFGKAAPRLDRRGLQRERTEQLADCALIVSLAHQCARKRQVVCGAIGPCADIGLPNSSWRGRDFALQGSELGTDFDI